MTETEIAQVHEKLLEFPTQFKEEVRKVIIGQEAVLDLLVISLFCGGHVLLTGVPGLAKTLLIKSLAQLFHLDFNRIQCTPDLMPSDITGVEILEEAATGTAGRQFRFVAGPLFTNLLLADEINRTSPRTQSALLQAMQEHQVSIGGKTHQLPQPFIVFATQNPIDSEGTYPLPEAQLDRFLFNIDVDYPSLEEEQQIATQAAPSPEQLQALFDGDTLKQLQQLIPALPIAPHLVEWVVAFVRSTRPQESKHDAVQRFVEWGAGVRASQNIVLAAKAKAALSGHNAVTQEDIESILIPVLRHRIIVNFAGEAEGWSSEKIVEALLER